MKFKYITQARTRPPTFVLFGNRNEVVNDSYIRFLTNSLRTELGLEVATFSFLGYYNYSVSHRLDIFLTGHTDPVDAKAKEEFLFTSRTKRSET